MLPALINPIAILISLSTATGIFIHDTRIDKATMTVMAAPVEVAAYEANNKQASVSPDLHTHVERGSLTQAIHDLKVQNPRIQPRGSEDKKYLLQKRVTKGHHAFDNYNLPIV